jgi:hypothetical protein
VASGRLIEQGLDPAGLTWDAVRQPHGWILRLDFTSKAGPGRARWQVDLASRSLVPLNEQANWIGQADEPDSPIPPSRHLSAVPGLDNDFGPGTYPDDELSSPLSLLDGLMDHRGLRSPVFTGEQLSPLAEPAEVYELRQPEDEALSGWLADTVSTPRSPGRHASTGDLAQTSEAPDRDAFGEPMTDSGLPLGPPLPAPTRSGRSSRKDPSAGPASSTGPGRPSAPNQPSAPSPASLPDAAGSPTSPPLTSPGALDTASAPVGSATQEPLYPGQLSQPDTSDTAGWSDARPGFGAGWPVPNETQGSLFDQAPVSAQPNTETFLAVADADQPAAEPEADESEPAPTRSSRAHAKRSSVPSWDEIVFGSTRSEE